MSHRISHRNLGGLVQALTSAQHAEGTGDRADLRCGDELGHVKQVHTPCSTYGVVQSLLRQECRDSESRLDGCWNLSGMVKLADETHHGCAKKYLFKLVMVFLRKSYCSHRMRYV